MAELNNPYGVFVSNGEVYIADTFNHRVRKVLRNGQIVTICGTGKQGYNGDGQLAVNAQLSFPHSVVISSSNQVYISEMDCGQRIRKIDRSGIISTICGTGKKGYNGDGQLAVNAMISYPYGLFVTEDDEVLFADCLNHRVRRIDRNGMISSIAGNGNAEFDGDGKLATSASLSAPTGVFQYKNEIYISDNDNDRIRKIDCNGIVSTIAGTENTLPESVFVHNDEVYFADIVNTVCKIQPNGSIKTIAGFEYEEGFNGNDQLTIECILHFPKGIFVDHDSQIYIADSGNHCIRMIDQNGMMRNFVGTGQDGYSGDVPFDFHQYPHIGPLKKKHLIKPFPQAYLDLIVICDETDSFHTNPPNMTDGTEQVIGDVLDWISPSIETLEEIVQTFYS